MRDHSDVWIAYFASRGYPEARPLSAGMEAAAYDLGSGLVGKVWARRSSGEIEDLRAFYSDLEQAHLPFATPRIVEVHDVGDAVVTFEPKLKGDPLREKISDDEAEVPEFAARAIVTILTALAAVPATPTMRSLRVLDEPQALWDHATDWPAALAGLLERRFERWGDTLRAVVPDFDRLFAATCTALADIAVQPCVVHGDICPENILVDADGNVTGLLDFGFFSTAGDPTFDASIAAGIYNMYGAFARTLDDYLLELLERHHAHSRDRMLLYRACYAIATSNVYDPTGRDGHSRWCADMLRREDVRAVIL